MNNEVPQVQTKGWDKIIAAVRTPLGYAVFAALSGLLILPISKIFDHQNIQNALIYVGLFLVCLSIVYVFAMSVFRPEALKGERVDQQKKIETEKHELRTESKPKEGLLSLPPTFERLGINEIGFFEDFVAAFPECIESSSSLITMFIHSRRWRENNNAAINKFLLKDRARIIAFLPDLKNHRLVSEIKSHFDDGDHLEFFIGDAYRYYFQLKSRFPEKIEVRCFALYPTYSFYKFDDSAIIAMYTNTTKRRSVPTIDISSDGEFWNFLGDDLDLLIDTCKSLSIAEIQEYAEMNKTERGDTNA